MLNLNKFNDYLKTILSDSEIKELDWSIKQGKTIFIKGMPGPTGKTTLKKLLSKNGITAIEEYDVHIVELNKIIDSQIADLSGTLYGQESYSSKWTEENANQFVSAMKDIADAIKKNDLTLKQVKTIFDLIVGDLELEQRYLQGSLK